MKKLFLFAITSLVALACSVAQNDSAFYPMSDPQNSAGWTFNPQFSDEFESGKFDSTKWLPYHSYWQGREPSWFSPKNIRIEDGKLILTVKNENLPEMPDGYHTYTTACVQSTQKCDYGYYEIKCKAADACITSSFWFQGDTTEIDVFEMVGASIELTHFDSLYPMNLHHYPGGWSTDKPLPENWKTPGKVAENFYVFGLEWNEQDINFYFEGEKIRTVPNTAWHEPKWMFMDMETFKWHGYPPLETLPADYEIEYVRAWTKERSLGSTSE